MPTKGLRGLVPLPTTLCRKSSGPKIMSKYTAFRCPEDLLELAKIKAKKDRRSLSNYIITLIEKDVRDPSITNGHAHGAGQIEEKVPAPARR
ncbi:MAG TPA: hypothetical protein VGO11_06225 [Chthoniobacteraceae bacterium]|jgi:hypothetical protein|nr:hypothetical protein [Chthoniobacteraceae bacterium]